MSGKIAKPVFLLLAALVVFVSPLHAATARWWLHKRLAIIIDDMGYDKPLAYRFASLDLPLAFSFLPDAPYSEELARYMGVRGYAVMIHMPSEPLDYPKDNPGKNAIYVSTSKRRTLQLLARAYKRIPWAVGLNNHMGSRILKDKRHLDYIMEFLRSKHMFFIDSATVEGSLGCKEAHRYRVLCARRRVFLDNIKNVAYIKNQIKHALALLKKYDDVVAIGHCDTATYEALREMRPILKRYMIGVEYIVK